MASMDRQQKQQRSKLPSSESSSVGGKSSAGGKDSVGGKGSVVGGSAGVGKQRRRTMTSKEASLKKMGPSKKSLILGVPEKARALVGD